MKAFFLAALLLFSTLNSQSLEIDIRHLEPEGIGFNQGYTTFSGFFSSEQNSIFLSDFRAHFFNDGRFASNLGIGMRTKTARAWGGNLYYDYRKGVKGSYNQLGIGFESLGSFFDFRANGYLPLGKRHHFISPAKFYGFEGHHLNLFKKQEFALSGCDLIFGFHLLKNDFACLSLDAGPYYFRGNGKQAIGGDANVKLTFFDCLTFQGGGSYDSLFHARGQGEVGVSFSFGRKEKKKRKCKPSYLSPPERKEIIVLKDKKKVSTAIDPQTGLPYEFWFVDNQSSSLGTYESPFPTLVEAQDASSEGDVIYVFPGDGTTTGMNLGFLMKPNQKLFGSGVDQNLLTLAGSVIIPAQSSLFPIISDEGGAADAFYLISVQSGCEVSGLYLKSFSPSAASIANATRSDDALPLNGVSIHNNIIETSGSNSYGIPLVSYSGRVEIYENALSSLEGSGTINGILLSSPENENAFASVQNNSVNGFDFACIGTSTSLGDFPLYGIISDNTIQTVTGGQGIRIRSPIVGSIVRISNNTIVGAPAMSSFGVFVRVDETSAGNLTCVRLNGNSATSPGPFTGYTFMNLSPNPEDLRVVFYPDNIGDVSISNNPITQVSSGSCL